MAAKKYEIFMENISKFITGKLQAGTEGAPDQLRLISVGKIFPARITQDEHLK